MTARLEKVWRAIDPERLKRTLLDLLDIYSPSGKEEDIQLYLEELLTRAGFTVKRHHGEWRAAALPGGACGYSPGVGP